MGRDSDATGGYAGGGSDNEGSNDNAGGGDNGGYSSTEATAYQNALDLKYSSEDLATRDYFSKVADNLMNGMDFNNAHHDAGYSMMGDKGYGDTNQGLFEDLARSNWGEMGFGDKFGSQYTKDRFGNAVKKGMIGGLAGVAGLVAAPAVAAFSALSPFAGGGAAAAAKKGIEKGAGSFKDFAASDNNASQFSDALNNAESRNNFSAYSSVNADRGDMAKSGAEQVADGRGLNPNGDQGDGNNSQGLFPAIQPQTNQQPISQPVSEPVVEVVNNPQVNDYFSQNFGTDYRSFLNSYTQQFGMQAGQDYTAGIQMALSGRVG